MACADARLGPNPILRGNPRINPRRRAGGMDINQVHRIADRWYFLIVRLVVGTQ